MNVVFTSSGRRVYLLRAFRRALRAAGGGSVIALDADITAPTFYEADKSYVVPPVTSNDYVPTLVDICRKERAKVLIPLIDPELPALALSKQVFAEIGVVSVVSDPECVGIADDKLETSRFFDRIDVPSVRTLTGEKAQQEIQEGIFNAPMIVKPRRGSSGQGVVACRTVEELRRQLLCPYDIVVQDMLSGPEVTIDIMGDGQGNVLSAVPRKRLKVRGGEVERGVTVDDVLFRPYVLRIAQHLKPFGPINVQCFVTKVGPVFTEINPRFGGGYPLADAAGAQFPEILVRLVMGEKVTPCLGCYERGLLMTRYDEAFFIRAEQLKGGGRLTHLL